MSIFYACVITLLAVISGTNTNFQNRFDDFRESICDVSKRIHDEDLVKEFCIETPHFLHSPTLSYLYEYGKRYATIGLSESVG